MNATFTESDAAKALEDVRKRREAIENARLGHKTSAASTKAAPGPADCLGAKIIDLADGQLATGETVATPKSHAALAKGPGQRSAALAGAGRSGLIRAY
jgi:hypothetical protein